MAEQYTESGVADNVRWSHSSTRTRANQMQPSSTQRVMGHHRGRDRVEIVTRGITDEEAEPAAGHAVDVTEVTPDLEWLDDVAISGVHRDPGNRASAGGSTWRCSRSSPASSSRLASIASVMSANWVNAPLAPSTVDRPRVDAQPPIRAGASSDSHHEPLDGTPV